MIPAVGLCQPLTGVLAGTHGTLHPAPVRLVIQNPTDYATFFGGTPPTSPVIDFTKQDVLGVSMGSEPTGGYSIGIGPVEVRTSGFTAGYGYAYVVQHTPVPGVVYSPNPTQPFQVVTLPKGATLYNFVDEPIASGFSQLEFHVTNTVTHDDSTFTLHANGNYTFEPVNGAPWRGMATQSELQAVSAAVIGANPGKLPVTIPDTRTPAGTTVFSLETDVGGNSYFLHSAVDYFGSYTPQIQPLVNSLQAIETRIQGPVPFNSVTYWTGAGLTPYTETVTVDSAGNTIVNHAVGVGGTNYTGVATKSQLRALSEAVANAGVATLPQYPIAITDSTAPTPVLGTEAFSTMINGVPYTTSVASAGFYGAFSPRVKPLVDAFRDVAESVVGATAGRPVTGLVVYTPATTTPPTIPATLTVGTNTVGPSDPFFQLLSTLNGKTVTVDAIVVGTRAEVIDVQGTMLVADTMRAFPSPLGTASLDLAAGATVVVRDVSVPAPTYYELSTALASEGYVAAASVQLGNDVSAPPPAPVGGVTPATLTFPSTTLGALSGYQIVMLHNTGNATLTINAVTFTGADPTDFTQNNNCAVTLAPGASCTFNVAFGPTATGARAATLAISTSDSVHATTVGLSGNGVLGTPSFSVSPGTLTFLPQGVNTISTPQTVTISNQVGTAPLTIAIAYSGTNSAEFVPTSTCTTTLAAGATCTITFTFNPKAAGARTATLTITSNDPNHPTVTVPLNGTAVAPVAGVSTTALSFGNVALNASASQPVTVTNTGTAPLIVSIAPSGANASNTTQTNNCSPSVAPSGSCTITVTITPAALGAFTATLTIGTNDPVTPMLMVSVTANGTAAATPIASVSAPSVSFPPQLVGTTSLPQTVQLSNTGAGALSVSIGIGGLNPVDFPPPAGNCGASLAPTSSCAFTLTFRPTATGPRTATLTVSTNDPAHPTLTVTLIGNGI